MDPRFDVPATDTFTQRSSPSISPPGSTPQELIQLGLEEPLPSGEVIDELHEIYFNKCHHCLPILHKYRYLSSLDLPPHMRPPVCLQYAVWLLAASISDKHAAIEDVLYKRTRKYADLSEMRVSLTPSSTRGCRNTWETLQAKGDAKCLRNSCSPGCLNLIYLHQTG